MKKTLIIIIAVALAWAVVTSGPNFLVNAKEAPPVGGEPKPFNLPETATITLGNGLRATFIEFGIVPKVEIRVIVRAGNLNEDGNTWLADITGEMLKQGAGGRSSAEIAAAAAGMGGDLSVNVGPDQTSIGIDVLSEFGADAVALVAQVASDPALPEGELERIRQDFARQLSVSRTQSQPLAQEAFMGLLYGDHAYGRIFPTEDQLNAYTAADVSGFYQANFGAARTHVFVAGRFDHGAMESAIEIAFGGWARGPEPAFDVPSPATAKRVMLVDRPGATQSTIYLGLPVDDVSNPNYVQLQVTNTLLGGSFGSRVTANIREDKGYTYSPFARLSSRFHDTYWAQTADVSTEHTGPALKEIFFEIDRLQDEPPPAEELDRIKNYRAGIFILQNATRSNLINQLNFLDLQGLPRSYLTNYVQKVFAVTPAQISQMTREQLRDQDMTLVVVGDIAKITEQLKALPQLQGVEFEQ